MYAGRAVEHAPTRALLDAPSHPYTAALLGAVPQIDHRHKGALASIAGLPPRLDRGPFTCCTFEPRCRLAIAACKAAEPALVAFEPGHGRRCVRDVADVRAAYRPNVKAASANGSSAEASDD
jgi:oligopeptide/dipeptide ABC transporter ATP-binding protein